MTAYDTSCLGSTSSDTSSGQYYYRYGVSHSTPETILSHNCDVCGTKFTYKESTGSTYYRNGCCSWRCLSKSDGMKRTREKWLAMMRDMEPAVRSQLYDLLNDYSIDKISQMVEYWAQIIRQDDKKQELELPGV